MTRLFICALIFRLCVALRPTDTEGAVGSQIFTAAIANLSALSAKNRSNAADSLAFMETATNILSGIGSLEPPPSLTEDTITALNGVITLIQETVYGEMDAGHAADDAALAAAAAVASACNDALQVSTGTGTIHLSEERAISAQEHYQAAVLDLESKTQAKNDQSSAFDAHMGSIAKLSTCTAYPTDKSRSNWDAYFALPPDLSTFELQKAAYEDQKSAIDQAVTDMEESRDALAASKGALEDAYCNMLVMMRTGCNELDVCHSNALSSFEELKTQLEGNMELRKSAHTAGEAAVTHLRQILGLEGPGKPSTRTYELDIPDPDVKAACNVGAMEEQHTWEDFLEVSSCELPERVDASQAFTGEDSDLDGGGWKLVWKHSYMQVGSVNSNMAFFSSFDKPCEDLSVGWCNVPNKLSFGANQQMIMALHNDHIVYAYRGDINPNLDSSWRGAILKNYVKLIDECRSSNGLPPEPEGPNGGHRYEGLTFDKTSLGNYVSNCDTDRNGNGDCRWENCNPSFGNHKQMTLAMFVRNKSG